MIKSVAIIGAGAAGAAAAVAFAAEQYFERIRVFERRDKAGGTWIYDADPGDEIKIKPGLLPPQIDPRIKGPERVPALTEPIKQERFDRTPIYEGLTTNVPEIIMSFSDERFAYGPFVPHWIPKQYVQNYLASHQVDQHLALNTTVEDVSRRLGGKGWSLKLRRYDPLKKVDVWWEEEFEAVVLANGHYSVPFVPYVKGLEDFTAAYPGRVTHSKTYRTTDAYANKRVLVIGNSASGHDITTQLAKSGKLKGPVYQSRRSRSRWDGPQPPESVAWKPMIREYIASKGAIIFEDDTVLSDIDAVIYCTGYKPSFPFWNDETNGGPLYDYKNGKLIDTYQHTFCLRYPNSLGIIGIPRVLTFRSFEYQAVALARLFSNRAAHPLPSLSIMQEWETDRLRMCRAQGRAFHTILWDDGETMEWFRYLYKLAGLPVLEGKGRVPPVLGERERWAYDHVKKYPEPGGGEKLIGIEEDEGREEWVIVEGAKDSAWFV